MTKFLPVLYAVAAGALLYSGCGDKDPSTGDDAGVKSQQLWVATGWTQSGDEYNGFLATVEDLTGGSLDIADVVDLGTDMSFGTDEKGTVYVGRDDSPVIERWALDAGGVLQRTGSINFGSLGITSAMGGNRNVIQIISDTRAYYFDNEGYRVVVFNPDTMTITRNFSIADIAAGATSSSLNFITREGDRFFVSTRLWDEAEETVKELRVAIVSATSDTVEYVTDTRCGDMGYSVADDEGNVYFGSHHALAFFGWDDARPDVAKPCMLRIRQGESSFDPDYHVALNTLVDGYGGGLFQGPNGTAFVAKYDDGAGGDPGTGSFNGPVWRLHTIELGNEAASIAPVAGLEPVTRYVTAFDTVIDGALVPFLVTETETDSSYTSIADASAPAPGLSVTGALFGRAALLTAP